VGVTPCRFDSGPRYQLAVLSDAKKYTNPDSTRDSGFFIAY
jgi:hypothetical protein